MKRLLDARGIPMMVTFLPPDYLKSAAAFAQEARRIGLDPLGMEMQKPGMALEEICRRLGIDFVDLTPAFQNSDQDLYLKTDPHFSESGHALAASVLEDYFARRIAVAQRPR
jgi:hypothetical protein